jgi:beta-N-acetylhexosaminidase
VGQHHQNVTEVVVERVPAPKQRQRALAAAKEADVLVLGLLFAAESPEQQALFQELLALGKPCVLIALGTPGDLAFFPEAPVMLAAHGPSPVSAEAVAAVLFGHATPGGTLPLPIGELYARGHALRAGW